MAASALGPGEVLALLKPDTVRARDALKLTLMSLLAQGVLRFEERAVKGLLGTKPQKVLLQAKGYERSGGLEVLALAALSPLADGISMATAVKRLRKAFGSDLARFRNEHLLPALARKGLLEARSERYLLIFKRTRHKLTPAGESERDRLTELMEQARRMPGSIASDPAQALAIFAGLGAAVLLIHELWPHLQQLEKVIGPEMAASHGFADFNFSDMDNLDESLSDLDAGFDAAADSGGAGGGGDSGGGGD